MDISKRDLEELLEKTFRMGMVYGYGIDHENIAESEEQAWQDYSKTIKQIQ